MVDTVAVTPTTKGARVWVQGLDNKGIQGDRFSVQVCLGSITLTFGPNEKRKVTRAKGGLVDLQSKAVTAWAQGATRATVHVINSTTIVLQRA